MYQTPFRTPHRDVGLPVFVVVARHGHVAKRSQPPLRRGHSDVGGALDVPGSRRWTPDRNIALISPSKSTPSAKCEGGGTSSQGNT